MRRLAAGRCAPIRSANSQNILGPRPSWSSAAETRLHPADEIFPENDDEYNVYRIRVGDIVVRYVEDSFVIQVTVEGEMPTEAVEELKTDLIEKFGLVEQAAVRCRNIPAL